MDIFLLFSKIAAISSIMALSVGVVGSAVVYDIEDCYSIVAAYTIWALVTFCADAVWAIWWVMRW